jgi:hypothetical protein
MQNQLIDFLIKDLAVSEDSLQFALGYQQESQSKSKLVLILWEFGLITLSQLETLCRWLEEKNYLDEKISF